VVGAYEGVKKDIEGLEPKVKRLAAAHAACVESLEEQKAVRCAFPATTNCQPATTNTNTIIIIIIIITITIHVTITIIQCHHHCHHQ
jgi:hypothetical protein